MILMEMGKKLTKEEFVKRLKDPLGAVIEEVFVSFAEQTEAQQWFTTLAKMDDNLWHIETRLVTRDDGVCTANADNVKALFNHLFKHSGFADHNNLAIKKIHHNGGMLRWALNAL